MPKKAKKKVAKYDPKEVFRFDCSTCFYGLKTNQDPLTFTERTLCRRYPNHIRFNSDHWCGEFKDK